MEKRFVTPALSLVAFLILPQVSFASVRINEVAWMGTAENQYGEWVELYNDGATEVDLTGAKLYEGGGQTLIISLAKGIAAHGYYLIERTTATSPDPVPGINDLAGPFGGSGLSNSGEYLVLKLSDGTIADSIDASTGWTAGDAATKQTMQRTENGNWITAVATPGALNAVASSAGAGDANGNSNTFPTATSSVAITTDDGTAGTVSKNTGTDTMAYSSPYSITEKKLPVKVLVSAGRDRTVAAGAPVFFDAQVTTDKGESIDGGIVSWSFGDGSAGTGEKAWHTYRLPGDYAVLLNVSYGDGELVSVAKVSVFAPSMEITSAPGGDIGIFNKGAVDINLGGWKINCYEKDFVFPRDTIVFGKNKMVLSREVSGVLLFAGHKVKLANPSGQTVASFTYNPTTAALTPVASVTAVAFVSVASSTEKSAAGRLADVEAALVKLSREISAVQKQPTAKVAPTSDKKADSVSVVFRTKPASAASSTDSQSYVVHKPVSIFATIFSLPKTGYTFMKSVFF